MTVADNADGCFNGQGINHGGGGGASRGFDRFVASELASLLKFVVVEHQQRLQEKLEHKSPSRRQLTASNLRDAMMAHNGPSDDPGACQQALPLAPFVHGEPPLVNVPASAEEEIQRCGDNSGTLLMDAIVDSACKLPTFEEVVGKQVAILHASMVAEFQQRLTAAIHQIEHGIAAVEARPNQQPNNADHHLEMLRSERARHGDVMHSCGHHVAADEQVGHEVRMHNNHDNNTTVVSAETDDVEGLSKQWWTADTKEGNDLSQERIPLSDDDVLLLVQAMRQLDLAMDRRSLVTRAMAGRVLSCYQGATLLTAIQMGLMQRIVAIEVLASRLTDLPTGLPQLLEPLPQSLRGEIQRKLSSSLACDSSNPSA